jgi:uncharacterized protein YbaR (Trm112 family)
MVTDELIDILRCPESRQRLSRANQETVDRLNASIAARQARNRGGDTLEQPLEAALIREDGKLLYPIVDDIPIMLVDEAIPLDTP